MKITVTKNLLKNVYIVTIGLSEIDDTDIELFSDYNEPSIDIGGDINDPASPSTPVLLTTLPSTFKKIPSQFPITYRFPATTYGVNSQKIAEGWANDTSLKIENAMNTLRAKIDDFSQVEEIIV